MFEFIKSEKLYDWNANETPAEISTSYVGSEETKVDFTEESTDNDRTVSTRRKKNKSYVGKSKIPTRLKICSGVPVNHFGAIPGIPVGMCWEKRIQVSESGVHRPPVAGIHGRETEGAYSIVFSGTYAEDQDFGEEFFYSGCGGGVTDPHKLISGQVRDQTLTCHNKSLAVSCNAPVNDQVGAEAEDWQAGKPIRVVRTYKLKKHSEYAPDEGNRYDGIYKVVKYFPTIGQSGLMVWRFLLRRDDPEPAPWTDEGKKAIAEKNLQIIRAKGTDYIQKINKKAKKKKVKGSTAKSPLKNNEYLLPNEEVLEKIIKEALNDTSDVEDDESPFDFDWLPKKSKSKKAKTQLSRKKTKTKSKKLGTQNATVNKKATPKSKNCEKLSTRNPSYQHSEEESCARVIDLQMELATANSSAVHIIPDSDPLATTELPKSARKRNRKQKLNETLDTDPCEYTFYPIFDMKNEQREQVIPQNVEEEDDIDCEIVEIVPDINSSGVYAVPASLEERNCDSNSDRSGAANRQSTESASKLRIQVISVKSLNYKPVAANRKTTRNKKNNIGRSRITNVIDSLETSNQIDLTMEEDEPYVLPVQVEKFIDKDTLNKTIWDYCKKNFLKNEADFLDVVKRMFTCRYCCQLAANPVTTPCDHNVCLECISNNFLKQMFLCPDCRNNLGPSFTLKENRNLANALENLFPD